MAFCSGLKVDEGEKFKIENIYPNDHKIKLLGKDNKGGFTILPDIVVEFLRLYCKENKITSKTGYLFESTNNKEYMNEKTITNYFSYIKKKYNLDENLTFYYPRILLLVTI